MHALSKYIQVEKCDEKLESEYLAIVTDFLIVKANLYQVDGKELVDELDGVCYQKRN